jgi:putative membrane protein
MIVQVLVGFVALEHVGFGVLEMLLFSKPAGRKVFRTTEAFSKEAAPLAANQGLYNLFLVAGLVWSLIAAEPQAHALKIFFLGCVVVAGLFGAATVSARILVLQALPAAVALALVLFA